MIKAKEEAQKKHDLISKKETIDGVETKIYGGTTSSEAANNVSKLEYYNHKSLKVRRYADVVIDQKHSAYALYSTLPNTICTTNEVEFEIKDISKNF